MYRELDDNGKLICEELWESKNLTSEGNQVIDILQSKCMQFKQRQWAKLFNIRLTKSQVD